MKRNLCFILIIQLLSIQLVISQSNQGHTDGIDNHDKEQCLSDKKRQEIRIKVRKNINRLVSQGALDTTDHSHSSIVLFEWPLQQASGFNDPSYYSITNYVDHDPSTGSSSFNQYGATNEDYDCGVRTYDNNSGYNHLGIDIGIHPFSWDKMDNNAIEVVSAKSGTIIDKEDGYFDQNCSCANFDWNAITILHGDGSISIYGHMKNGSITSKTMGQSVSTGEYLGVVGSSGCSTGPHLHFEVYENSTMNNLIDPYGGPCNAKNGNTSWWANQKPHEEPFIKKIMTHDAEPITFGCPNQQVMNLENTFNACDQIYFSVHLRDYEYGTTISNVVKNPNNLIINSNPINYTNSNSNLDFSPNFTWKWNVNIGCNPIGGQWTLESTYNGQTVIHNFNVETCTDGIQNGDETAIDCGGSVCPSCQPNLYCVSDGQLSVTNNNIDITNVVLGNNGSVQPPNNSRLGYYLASNTSISASDYLIESDLIFPISANGTMTKNENITPSNIVTIPPDGAYFVGMYIDYLNEVSESNENDNGDCFFSTPQVIIGCTDSNAHNYVSNANFDNNNCETCTDGIQNGDETGVDCGGSLCSPCVTTPNLYCVSGGSIALNANVISISSVQVGNNGGGSAIASSLGYYFSTNNFISITDYLVGTDNVASLGVGQTSTENIPISPSNIVTMPPDGTYFVGMLIDYQNVVSESNEIDNNDCFFTSPQVIIGCTDPNAHNYVSNANFDNNNCETCTDGVQNGDEAGVDCGGILCSPCGIDLYASNCGTATVTGTTISISGIEITNGGSAASGASELGYYISTNSIISTADILIGTDFVTSLNSGGLSNENFSVDISTLGLTIPSGSYYIGFLVDHLSSVSETDEANNNDCFDATARYHATTVTSIADSGFGSIRQAIVCANTNQGSDIIDFNINGPGTFILSPLSVLPFITDDNTTIDATTQPNWFLGKIVIDGINTTNAWGVVCLNTNNFELYGIKIQNYDYAGIWCSGNNIIIGEVNKGNVSVNNQFGLYVIDGSDCEVYANYFGVLEDGATAAGNMFHGIRSLGMSRFVIGKSGAGNIIGANGLAGIGIGEVNYTDIDYSIRFNFIGTSTSGADLGNTNSGIDKQPTALVTDIDIWNNTIAFNGVYGVWGSDSGCTFWDPYNNSYYCNNLGGIQMEGGANSNLQSPVIIHATTSLIEGTAQPGALLELRYSDTQCNAVPCQARVFIGTDTADENGNWSIEGNFPLGVFVLANQGINTQDWSTSAFSSCSIIITCPVTLNLSADYSSTLDLEASNLITADNIILTNATVAYDAGNCVELNPGFEVELGSTFNAYIDGCGDNGNEPVQGSDIDQKAILKDSTLMNLNSLKKN